MPEFLTNYLSPEKGSLRNHKRVYRIYRELELNLRIKPRLRLLRDRPEPPSVPVAINQVWSMAFMSDALMDGRKFENPSTSLMTTTEKGWALKWTSRCRQAELCEH